MLVSIIIAAYNAERTLAECLAAATSQSWAETEVIVVDDGSTDGTAAIARSFPGVIYIHQSNAGPAAARNRGAAAARGEWLAFTDSDCIPHSDWIEHLMTWAQPGVDAIGGTYGIANPQSLLARIVHAEIRTRHIRQPREVDFLGSFNVMYRAQMFHALGGFDETFRQASGEDNDLAYRLVEIGSRLVFTNDAIVDHYHPDRLWPYLKTQARHGFWRVKLYKQHPDRTTGDHYAGWLDTNLPFLLYPTLGIEMILAIIVAAGWLSWSFAGISAQAAVALTLLLLSKGILASRLYTCGYRAEALAFPVLSILRDFARLFGALRGVIHFTLLRRSIA